MRSKVDVHFRVIHRNCHVVQIQPTPTGNEVRGQGDEMAPRRAECKREKRLLVERFGGVSGQENDEVVELDAVVGLAPC